MNVAIVRAEATMVIITHVHRSPIGRRTDVAAHFFQCECGTWHRKRSQCVDINVYVYSYIFFNMLSPTIDYKNSFRLWNSMRLDVIDANTTEKNSQHKQKKIQTWLTHETRKAKKKKWSNSNWTEWNLMPSYHFVNKIHSAIAQIFVVANRREWIEKNRIYFPACMYGMPPPSHYDYSLGQKEQQQGLNSENWSNEAVNNRTKKNDSIIIIIRNAGERVRMRTTRNRAPIPQCHSCASRMTFASRFSAEKKKMPERNEENLPTA